MTPTVTGVFYFGCLGSSGSSCDRPCIRVFRPSSKRGAGEWSVEGRWRNSVLASGLVAVCAHAHSAVSRCGSVSSRARSIYPRPTLLFFISACARGRTLHHTCVLCNAWMVHARCMRAGGRGAACGPRLWVCVCAAGDGAGRADGSVRCVHLRDRTHALTVTDQPERSAALRL